MLRNIIENNNPVIRGEVYLAELPSGSGSEQVGKRPVVVLSNNTNNAHSNIINVAAITSKNKPLPVHVYVGRNGGTGNRAGNFALQDSTVMLEQTMVVDKARLIHKIGCFSDYIMSDINKALMTQFALA